MIKDAAYYESMFNNRAAVPEFQTHFDSWAARSEQARRSLDVELDVPYGDDRMETMDIFRPRGAIFVLGVFVLPIVTASGFLLRHQQSGWS